MSNSIRVLIVDDHAIVRRGIGALLDTEPDITVVGQACNGYKAIEKASALKPDIILMDLVMPEMGGIEAITRITAENPQARILVLTSFGSDEKVLPALKAGALGYLLKMSSPEEMVEAIHRLHKGESWLDPVIARKLLHEISTPLSATPALDPLTERELTVLRLVAQGLSNRQIASELVISEATVRTHVSNILSKLQLASRTQAALWALREGIASLDNPTDT